MEDAGDSGATVGNTSTAAGNGWQPGKARDVFASVDGVTPVSFTGLRAHALYKGPALTSMYKLNLDDFGSSAMWLSLRSDVRFEDNSRGSAMVEMDLFTRNWNYEMFGSLDGARKVDASVQVQVAALRRLSRARLDVDFACPGKTASLSVDPKLRECAFQYLQAVNTDCCRLAVGFELAFKDARRFGDRTAATAEPAVMAKYAGPDYLVSGRLNPITKSARLACYHHCNDALQTGVSVTLDPARSAAVTRLALRVQSDATQLRVAVGTDGVANGLWEQRLSARTAVSVSAFRNYWNDVSGLGVGLSFGSNVQAERT